MGIPALYQIYRTIEESNSSGGKSKKSTSSSKTKKSNIPTYKPETPLSILNDHSSASSYAHQSYLYNVTASAIKANPEVFAIIQKLIYICRNIRHEKKDQYEEIIISLTPNPEHYIEASKAVESLGFKVTKAGRGCKYLFMVPNDKYKLCYDDAPKDKDLNGIDLTIEQLLSGKNPYAERLEEFLKANPNAKEELLSAQKLVKKLSRNKLALMLSQDRQDRLSKAQKKLEEAEQKYKTEQEYIEDSIFFDNLTDEQKAIVEDYLLKRQDFEKAIKIQKKVIDKREYAEGNYPSYVEKEVFYEINNSIISDAIQGLTPEELLCLEDFYVQTANLIFSSSEKELNNLCSTFPPFDRTFSIAYITNEVYKKCQAYIEKTNGQEPIE